MHCSLTLIALSALRNYLSSERYDLGTIFSIDKEQGFSAVNALLILIERFPPTTGHDINFT